MEIPEYFAATFSKGTTFEWKGFDILPQLFLKGVTN